MAKVYTIYRHQDGFREFANLYDIGLPLAFLVHDEIIIDLTNEAQDYIDQTWDSLLEWLNVKDTGFDSLEEIFEASPVVEMEG